jgi:hypothetical protein
VSGLKTDEGNENSEKHSQGHMALQVLFIEVGSRSCVAYHPIGTDINPRHQRKIFIRVVLTTMYAIRINVS